MARVSFDSVFNQYPDGSLEPRQMIRIGGITFGPGIRFSQGTAFAGIDFTQYIGRDLEIETDGNITVIKGIYATESAAR